MTEIADSYMEDLSIDLHALEEEWVIQPQLYMKYAQLAAQAQMDRDRAKEKLDVVRAEVDDAIRTEPLEYGAPKDKSGNAKITEAWIAGTIVLQEEYKDAVQAVNDANYHMNIYRAAVNAFEHRKKALENEVQLWAGGYWSAPHLPHESAAGKRLLEAQAEARSEVETKQRRQLNRQRKKGGK